MVKRELKRKTNIRKKEESNSRNNKLNPLAFGYAGATVSGLCMLLLGIGWNIGVYSRTAEQMAKWHLLFSKSVLGIIGGIVEAGVISFVFLYVLIWLYNKFA